MKNLIILLGPPVSGKGTQASLLNKKLSYVSLSTGSMLRKEVATGSELGVKIAKRIDCGNLVEDSLMFKILEKEVKNIDALGLILDGFPRTLQQAVMLDECCEAWNFKLRAIFLIKLDRNIILSRVAKRITCKNCGTIYNTVFRKPKVEGKCDVCGSGSLKVRDDDISLDAINKRIDIFNSNIVDIKSFYEKKSLIFSIDGLKDVETISTEIMKILIDR